MKINEKPLKSDPVGLIRLKTCSVCYILVILASFTRTGMFPPTTDLKVKNVGNTVSSIKMSKTGSFYLPVAKALTFKPLFGFRCC